jgi:predicted acylesterase/phospholipase RssA
MGAINGYILALHTVDEVEETIKELSKNFIFKTSL